tara:strand:+ start:2002 stop:2373 length:372 start_codon:yes stop_codon:yes gene_type:complete
MNISKIIFYEKDYKIIANKKFGYKFLNKYFFTFVEPKRYKRYFPYWEIESKGYKDIVLNEKIYYFLITYKNYECFNYKNECIKKDFTFYKYITIKDMKLNKGIKDLSLASELINESSMELLLK